MFTLLSALTIFARPRNGQEAVRDAEAMAQGQARDAISIIRELGGQVLGLRGPAQSSGRLRRIAAWRRRARG